MVTRQLKSVYVLFWEHQDPTQPAYGALTAEFAPWWDIHAEDPPLGSWSANARFIKTAIRRVEPLKGILVVHSGAETKPDIYGAIDAEEQWASWALHEYRRRNDLSDQPPNLETADILEDTDAEARALEGEADPHDGLQPSSFAGARRRGMLPARSYDAVEMRQEEDELVARYATSRGVKLGPLSRTHNDGSRVQIDAIDADCLIEAKSKAGSDFVRMAIGQVLDYRRLEPKPARSMILLPEWPRENLVQLANELGILVCAEQADGTFETRG